MSYHARDLVFARYSLAAIVLLAFIACGGSGGSSNTSTPTAPTPSPIILQTASVSIAGQDVTNGSWSRGNHNPGSTRFEATLHRDDMPALGEMVFVEFDHPQGMNGMMGQSGRFELYDDGTHGDRAAGDGLYCLEDSGMGYGFHHGGASHGQYHYEYFGQDHQGNESNRLHVLIQVGP